MERMISTLPDSLLKAVDEMARCLSENRLPNKGRYARATVHTLTGSG